MFLACSSFMGKFEPRSYKIVLIKQNRTKSVYYCAHRGDTAGKELQRLPGNTLPRV